jgi:hypothetical protein
MIFADTRYLPPDDMAAFVARFEEILVAAAFDPATPTNSPTADAAPVAGRP